LGQIGSQLSRATEGKKTERDRERDYMDPLNPMEQDRIKNFMFILNRPTQF